jgi:hypothetical protein
MATVNEGRGQAWRKIINRQIGYDGTTLRMARKHAMDLVSCYGARYPLLVPPPA